MLQVSIKADVFKIGIRFGPNVSLQVAETLLFFIGLRAAHAECLCMTFLERKSDVAPPIR